MIYIALAILATLVAGDSAVAIPGVNVTGPCHIAQTARYACKSQLAVICFKGFLVATKLKFLTRKSTNLSLLRHRKI